MKKTIIAMSAIIISCTTVKAQEVSFGFKAGIQQNIFSLKYTEDGDWSRQSLLGTGFHVGGIADISLSEQFSIQPQLLFNSKTTAMSSEMKLKMMAIDLPVNFLYKNNGFFAGLGPNFSYGLSAKSSGDSEQDLYKKYAGEDEDEAEGAMLKRFELGANLTMGYQFENGLMISANYVQGLSNIAGAETAHTKYSTRLLGLSVGYMIGGRAK
ncbi:MAG: PorT family protein [Chitinophagaceae bacterium]|nr:PorT family protein [Chitinophagaceae bacterium]